MSVLVETSLGDIVVDLEVDKCPRTCANFLKLCKAKYYGLNAFFNGELWKRGNEVSLWLHADAETNLPVSKDFIAQTGDPSALGTGGESFASYHHKKTRARTPAPPRYFPPEILNSLKHTQKGTLSMAVAPIQPPGCGSQFFFTLKDGIEYLDGKHAVFGHVVEGLEVLDQINDAFVDKDGRPLKDIRIHHIEVLDDPFPDPDDGLSEPPSPVRPPDDPSLRPRIDESESIDPTQGKTQEELEEMDRKNQAEASALTLEMIGDLPFAHVRPPENILFVANLNAVTVDEDLELIFSR
jgi:peptidyl-prolyl cis-trans isomerase-like 4